VERGTSGTRRGKSAGSSPPEAQSDIAASWDGEYAAGRYAGAPPDGFVTDIIAAAAAYRLSQGLYIGCGNGRNLIPMLNAGLDLTGLDLSREAITQLRARRPDRVGRLIVGDLTALPRAARYDLVIGIQVFQHGRREQAAQHLTSAAALVEPGGLFCVRVNATESDIEFDHDRFEEDQHGGFSVRYRAGPKTGLDIHFFTAAELASLVPRSFTEVLPLRRHSTPRRRGRGADWTVKGEWGGGRGGTSEEGRKRLKAPPEAESRQSQWSQWEVIWRRG
jgi:SAM-dependent methyltransferase